LTTTCEVNAFNAGGVFSTIPLPGISGECLIGSSVH